MDADNEYEKKKIRDAIQTIETIQSMIDVSADRLEGLRTQCSTSAELTQQEIRTLEVGTLIVFMTIGKYTMPLNAYMDSGIQGLRFTQGLR